jgi:putative transposase
MTSDTTVHAFRHLEDVDDPLTAVLRNGARRLLAEVIEAGADAFLAVMQEERLADGRARFVR